MKILIVDDEAPARKLLKLFLQDHPDCEVVGEAADGFEGFRLIGELSPDVVFLDIQMPRVTGFELLELLDNPPVVVFATAYDQFAVQAFEKNAADYLLKPFGKERLSTALGRIRERLQLRALGAGNSVEHKVLEAVQERPDILERIAVKVRNKVHVIPVSQIIRIEAEGDYVSLVTMEHKYLKEFTMKYLDSHLPPKEFLRVHRSDFVRIDSVKGLEHASAEVWNVRMKNGDAVRASADGIKQLKKVLGM
jgi:two-component system LytT family response regulator